MYWRMREEVVVVRMEREENREEVGRKTAYLYPNFGPPKARNLSSQLCKNLAPSTKSIQFYISSHKEP